MIIKNVATTRVDCDCVALFAKESVKNWNDEEAKKNIRKSKDLFEILNIMKDIN